ncbi:inositol monophosphatase family protein [Nakamurella antarctica]|uniref:inositol monophosphatase family protein n=1 Tax=Nakamurella antarctica TaxID=1902245 RepID=UPI001EF08179|nr:inositol monophosphatase family protein [Nakamurella antarctica]
MIDHRHQLSSLALSDAELAAQLVTQAGTLAAQMLAAGLTVDTKTSISDVVSDADKAAESMIVAALALARPDDGVLGEEGAAAPGRRSWVIDPVDGTYNFVSGLPAWCSALALLDGEDLLLGAIFQPTTNELWVGGKGLPVTLNGVQVAPLLDRPLHEVAFSTYLHPPRLVDPHLLNPILAVLQQSATVRMIGSGSVELAAIAAGRLGLWLHADTHPWDWLPGAALVRAAGGVAEVFEHGGHSWHAAGPATAVAQAQQLVLAT